MAAQLRPVYRCSMQNSPLSDSPGRPPRKFDAILFDLDGTLLDTLADIAHSMNRALEKMRLPTHPIDRYRTMVGDGVEILVRRAIPPSLHDPKTMSDLAAAYREDYARHWADQSAPYPGILDMLNGLKQREIRTAVLSNKPHGFTVQCVERFLPTADFQIVLGAGTQFPHKPHPAAALHIADQMQLPTKQFLYLGDTNTDMKTAIAAGMFPVGATWGFRDEGELLASGAGRIVHHPRNVLEIDDSG